VLILPCVRLHPLHSGYLLAFLKSGEVSLQDEAVLAALRWHHLNVVCPIMLKHTIDGGCLNPTLVRAPLIRLLLIAKEEWVSCQDVLEGRINKVPRKKPTIEFKLNKIQNKKESIKYYLKFSYSFVSLLGALIIIGLIGSD
jgi:hypothetical protein